MTTTRKPAGKEYALITGASHGIGRELARVFARNGFNLVLVARNREQLETVAEELTRTCAVNCRVVPADLSMLTGVEDVYRRVHEEKLTVSILVNNAGVGSLGPFHQADFATEVQVINLNIIGLTYLTRLFAADMVEKGSGKILNVASVAGFWPVPKMSVYAATKAYVISFSQTLASELKGTGVSVSVLCPGSVETGFVNGGRKELSGACHGPVIGLLVRMRYVRADAVAAAAYRGLMKNKRLIIPGTVTRIERTMMRFIPQGLIGDIKAKSLLRPPPGKQ